MDSLQIIKPFVHKNKYLLIFYTLIILLTYPFESLIIPELFSKLFKDLNNQIDDKKLYNFFFYFTIFMTITNVAQMISTKIDTIIITEFNKSITKTLYEKILYYYENNYADLELGKILGRINILPSVLRELTNDLFNWLMPKILTVIIINIYFLYFDYKLSIICFIFLFSIIFYNYYKYKSCINLSKNKYNVWEDKSEIIQDKLSNLYSIYSTSKVKNEIDEFEKILNDYKSTHINAMTCSNKIKNRNSMIILIFFILILYYVASLYRNNKINQETMIKLYMILIFYVPSLTTIFNYLPDYTNHIGIVISINDYIKMINVENKLKPDIIITNGKIEIFNLNFGYNTKKKIFNNFNLTINSNDKIAIIGPSGNGKSTLIKLIMGYYKVDDNTIFIDGQDINKYNLASLRNQITFINQNNKLFNKTIYENIQYGNDLSKNNIDNYIIKYKLDQVFKNLPNGFNTNCGVNGDSLSGGQKQIIQLLRSTNKKNKIIILDEPTSALDNETKTVVLNIIKDLSKNSTLIIITHDNINYELIDKTIKIINGIIK